MRKILVVEDTLSLLKIYKKTLEMGGFGVYAAKDGEQGLKLALSEHPDLILLDVIMPKMDGLTVMKALREDDWGKNVPIILLTNLSPDTSDSLQAILEHKPAFYLLKENVAPDAMIYKIKEALNTK